MTPRALFKMAAQDVAATRGRSAVSAVGISLGVSVLLIVAGLGLGARQAVLEEVVRVLPLDMIEVVPKTLDLGLFKVGSGGLLGGATLDEETLKRLAALPHVKAAHPKLELKLPLGAQGGGYLFKRRLYTDLFVTGLPEELVQAEVGEGFKDQPDIVPVVISEQLIEIYNASVAPTLGTPQLTSETLKGFEFEIVVGRSLMLGSRGAAKEGVLRARIVGASRYAMRLGATVPITTGRRILAEYAVPGTKESFASVLLQADSPADVPELTDAVKAAGFSVDETAQRTSDIMTAATALASLVGLLVLALAALNIAHSFFASLSERRRELAILRAVGAKQTDLVLLVLVEAGLLGLTGGVLGSGLALAASWVVDLMAAALLPDFPFKPESFFDMPPSLFAAGLCAAVVASVLGALLPAMRAARGEVARALAEL